MPYADAAAEIGADVSFDAEPAPAPTPAETGRPSDDDGALPGVDGITVGTALRLRGRGW